MRTVEKLRFPIGTGPLAQIDRPGFARQLFMPAMREGVFDNFDAARCAASAVTSFGAMYYMSGGHLLPAVLGALAWNTMIFGRTVLSEAIPSLLLTGKWSFDSMPWPKFTGQMFYSDMTLIVLGGSLTVAEKATDNLKMDPSATNTLRVQGLIIGGINGAADSAIRGVLGFSAYVIGLDFFRDIVMYQGSKYAQNTWQNEWHMDPWSNITFALVSKVIGETYAGTVEMLDSYNKYALLCGKPTWQQGLKSFGQRLIGTHTPIIF